MDKKATTHSTKSSTPKAPASKNDKTAGQASENNRDQKKKEAPHHIVPDEPKYPHHEDTDPYGEESWVY